MGCPECGTDAAPVVFAVPPERRDDAPEGAATAAICPRCLAVDTAGAFGAGGAGDAEASEPAFPRVHDRFPRGAGGVAFALLVGKLPSVTLEKESARRLRAAAEEHGVDVALAFGRLVDAPGVEPWFDLERRAAQADALLG